MDKYKIISIIEGLIIIVLVIMLVSNKTNNKSVSDVDKDINQETTEKTKDYVGIYHINNYGSFNGGNYTEVNITLNDDNTCEFSIYKSDLYNCNYEDKGNDKIKIIFSTYVATGDAQEYNDRVFSALVLGWKLAPNKEGCEQILKDYKEKYPNRYNDYTKCEKAQQDYDITLLNNGLLFENKQFTKIK